MQRDFFKPKVKCFQCGGNIVECQCQFEATWVTELRQLYAAAAPRIRSTMSVERVKGMRFQFAEKWFALEFKREYQELRRVGPTGEDILKKSTYPNTTASILALPSQDASTKGATVIATATVGCWHKEPVFSKARGRERALRNATRLMDKEMRRAVWTAYETRNQRSDPPKDLPPVPVVGFVSLPPKISPVVDAELVEQQLVS